MTGAWRRATGRVNRADPEVLLVATDASVKGRNVGYGWLANDGRWGLGQAHMTRTQSGPEVVCVAELRAVAKALEGVAPGRRVSLAVDSQDALTFLTAWSKGSVQMPPGYLGSYRRRPTLHVLAELVRTRQATLTWTHVKAHTGDPLNEAADSLAKIAREWDQRRAPQAEVERRAASLVEAFLRPGGG